MRELRIPVLLKDREVEGETDPEGRWAPYEVRRVRVESLLDGPVSDRVAVVDVRADGSLAPAVPRPSSDAELLPQTAEPYREPAIIRWSVFAIVLETLALFESPDCLGRVIPWAFGHPQLLVVPEAGEEPNAFYDRSSCSLQFYYFQGGQSGKRIDAAASHDIVAHETAHAVLDGIAPWLYASATVQAVAIHESIADLTALFAATFSRSLASRALVLTAGNLAATGLFSSLAAEFGRGLGEKNGLRTLVDEDPGKPLALSAFGPGGRASEPHDVSVVLSRAFYALLMDAYDARLLRPPARANSQAHTLHFDGAPGRSGLPAQHAALRFAVGLVKRLLFRGLDYLPPADVGFLDLARAVLACDRAAHPEDTTHVRDLLVVRLLERGVGATAADLDTPFQLVRAAVGVVRLDAIMASTWHAMRLVEAHRAVLGIPPGVPFDVLPRVRVQKVLIRPTERPVRDEVLLKIAWRERDPVRAGPAGPLWTRHGATVAFDCASGEVCAWLRTDSLAQAEDPGVSVSGLHPARAIGAGRSGRVAKLPDAPAGVDATAFRELWGTLMGRG